LRNGRRNVTGSRSRFRNGRLSAHATRSGFQKRRRCTPAGACGKNGCFGCVTADESLAERVLGRVPIRSADPAACVSQVGVGTHPSWTRVVGCTSPFTAMGTGSSSYL
jgi:hypothetical protein